MVVVLVASVVRAWRFNAAVAQSSTGVPSWLLPLPVAFSPCSQCAFTIINPVIAGVHSFGMRADKADPPLFGSRLAWRHSNTLRKG